MVQLLIDNILCIYDSETHHKQNMRCQSFAKRSYVHISFIFGLTAPNERECLTGSKPLAERAALKVCLCYHDGDPVLASEAGRELAPHRVELLVRAPADLGDHANLWGRMLRVSARFSILGVTT